MNLYVSLNSFKAALGMQGGGAQTDERDDEFLRHLDATSRGIESACDRYFYPYTATKTFDTRGLSEFWFPPYADLLSVTGVTVDADGDGTFEVTLVENTDFRLLPYDQACKRAIRLMSRSALLTSFTERDYSLRIAGRWGYTLGTELVTTTTEELDASETGVDFTVAEPLVSAGDTIVVDSEDMYVSAAQGGTLTVMRAVNGTVAATHLTAASVYRRRYERDIEEATLFQAVRFWREKQTGGASNVGGEFGSSFSTLYPAIRDMLVRHRRVIV